MEDAVIVQDSTGRIVFWNQASERVFGYSKEEACLHNIDLVVPNGSSGESSKLFRQAFAGKAFQETETVRKAKDGREIEVIESLLPVKPESANVQAIVHLIRDPAEVRRKKALEILSNQPQIALTLAHELRSPLAALNNITYLLEHRMDPKHLPVMKKLLALCDSIITNLLEFTITGKPEKQQASLQQILDQVFSLVEIPDHIEVQHSDARNVQLWIDQAQIRQCFLNLVQNALEAIGDRPGRLEIRIQEEAALARIDFADTGPGMPESVFKRLFQPLVTSKRKGMGLGLLTCKQLVEANGGTIHVENRRGQGCTFSLTLPKFNVSQGTAQEQAP
jgi:PAS domain S-box-containing protein